MNDDHTPCDCEGCRKERELVASGLLDDAYAELYAATLPFCEKLAAMREGVEVTPGQSVGLLLAVAARIAHGDDVPPQVWVNTAIETWNTEVHRATERQGVMQ